MINGNLKGITFPPKHFSCITFIISLTVQRAVVLRLDLKDTDKYFSVIKSYSSNNAADFK